MFSQLPCAGVKTRSSRRASSGGNASYRDVVRVQVVAHQRDALGAGEARMVASQRIRAAQSADVRRSVTRTPRHAPSGSTNIHATQTPSRTYSWSTRSTAPGDIGIGARVFGDQLLRLLVHAHHRTLRIPGPPVHLQNLLHPRHEPPVAFRRNAPHRPAPRLQVVFFSVCRTVSWLIDSTTSNSTRRSASSRSVQRDRPSGACEHASCASRATSSPRRLA